MAQSEYEPQRLTRIAAMHVGSARAHLAALRERPETSVLGGDGMQHFMLAASSQVIGASLLSLVSPREAISQYRAAARMYRDIRHDYWMPLALAAGDVDAVAEATSGIEDATSLSPQAVAFGMVASAASRDRDASRRDESLTSAWQHIGNVPVGRLGVPLDDYGACARAMRATTRKKDFETFARAARQYLLRAAEVRRSASHDAFHWTRLQSNILPAEPEAIAMTTTMSIVAHDVFGASLEKIGDMDPHARILMDVGEDMRAAARETRG
jgi:hypothetical protein